MTDYQLIVSNPPHRSPDPVSAAPHLQCAAAEARMKLNFPAPEIWLAETANDAARSAASALLGQCVNVVWIPGSVLASVPGPTMGSEIATENDTVVITTAMGRLEINPGQSVVAVLGEPVQQDARPVSEHRSMITQPVPARSPSRSMPSVPGVETVVGAADGAESAVDGDQLTADARELAEKRQSDGQLAAPTELFLDVYALGEGGWKATRLMPSHTDFSGLGDRKQPMARANIGAIVDLLKGDYDARVDERLVKVTYKPTIVSGLALTQVLGRISEHLAALPLFDIGSRLAFLTSKPT